MVALAALLKCSLPLLVQVSMGHCAGCAEGEQGCPWCWQCGPGPVAAAGQQMAVLEQSLSPGRAGEEQQVAPQPGPSEHPRVCPQSPPAALSPAGACARACAPLPQLCSSRASPVPLQQGMGSTRLLAAALCCRGQQQGG